MIPCVGEFLQDSPPRQRQNMVHQIFEQIKLAVWQLERLELHRIIFRLDWDAWSAPVCTERGIITNWWSDPQPYSHGTIADGEPSIALFQIATCKWHIFTFSENASFAGGRVHNFGENDQLFPVFTFHNFNLHSVIDLEDSTTFSYVADMNATACDMT